MKASEARLLDFLKKPSQFRIPDYQRTYSWTEIECKKLWDDILRTGKNNKIAAHFIGSMVYIEKDLYQVSEVPQLLVIDGQQRLTTISLIIEALSRHLKDKELIKGFSYKKLKNYYLINQNEEGDERYKLILTQTDKDSLLAILDNKSLSTEFSNRIQENFKYFEEQIKNLKNLEDLCKGLSKLIIVDISLNRNQDNPQLIFESMNSTGKELSQTDLIRNFILMDLEPKVQTKIYRNYWRPMEELFGQENYNNFFDSFVRDYLTMKNGEIPNKNKIYETFKSYTQSNIASQINKEKYIEELIFDLKKFAKYYCAIVFKREENSLLKKAFNDVKELKATVSHPLLLKLYHDYEKGILSDKDFESIVRFIESYIFRRAVCQFPTNALNKIFATYSRYIKEDNYLESFKAHLLLMTSRNRFPKNIEFFDKIQNTDLYSFRNRNYFLRKLENYNRKEKINLNNFTIEHILPQNPKLSEKWKKSLGQNWKEIQDKYLHTLGNLTLTAYNSEYKDKFFTDKLNMEGGFKNSPLYLNEELRSFNTWNEETIKKRSKKLADKALSVWFIPSLSQEILDKYQTKEEKSYSLDSYPQLKKQSIRALFDAFRIRILNLDPDITEKFNKYYIAYKVDSIFTSVSPTLEHLKINICLKSHEVNDPKALVIDKTGVGKWGTGDLVMHLHSKEEIPYIIDICKQALKKELDEE